MLAAAVRCRKKEHYINKIIHVLENLNFASPFCDWDEGEHSTQEFRARFRATHREMAATFCVNILVTGVMTIPLCYTGERKNPLIHLLERVCLTVLFLAYQVNQRHAFLKWLVTVKDDEVISYENINSCLVTVTTCLFVFSMMEVAAYFVYAIWVDDAII